MEELSDIPDITYRAMMGEYIIYYREKVIGGLYDNRFLIKAVPTAISFIENPVFESPYQGAKDMIRIEELDSSYLRELFDEMFEELPLPKRKKNNNF